MTSLLCRKVSRKWKLSKADDVQLIADNPPSWMISDFSPRYPEIGDISIFVIPNIEEIYRVAAARSAALDNFELSIWSVVTQEAASESGLTWEVDSKANTPCDLVNSWHASLKIPDYNAISKSVEVFYAGSIHTCEEKNIKTQYEKSVRANEYQLIAPNNVSHQLNPYKKVPEFLKRGWLSISGVPLELT